MLPCFISSPRALHSVPRYVVAGVVVCTWWAAIYALKYAKDLIRSGSSFSPSPDLVAWAIFIVVFALVVLAVVCWIRGDFDLLDEQYDRREQDDFRDEQHDRWEESEFGTEYGEEWEEDYVFEEPILNEEHRKQLKQLFRRAAQSCHPDKAPEHLKDIAHQLFAQLNAAFQANDIEGVQNICDIVCSGVFRVDRINSQSVASSR